MQVVPTPFQRHLRAMTYRKRVLPAATVAAAMEELRRARDACIRVRTQAPINGEHYRAVGVVMDAIDGFAEVATGQRDHFHAKMCPVNHGPKTRD